MKNVSEGSFALPLDIWPYTNSHKVAIKQNHFHFAFGQTNLALIKETYFKPIQVRLLVCFLQIYGLCQITNDDLVDSCFVHKTQHSLVQIVSNRV